MATTRLSTVIGNVIVGATGPQGPQGAQGATPAIGGSNTHIQFNNSGSLGGTANLVWNHTGLGVGTNTPARKLQVQTTGDNSEILVTTVTSGNPRLGMDASGAYYNWIQTDRSSGAIQFAISNSESMRLNANGNLGLGVTPTTTWNSAFKVTEIKSAGNAFFAGGSGWTLMSSNAFYGASGWQYGASGNLATAYEQYNGTHVFKNAPNNGGAAGATCSFTQAMTLDASGNLIVGDTSSGRRFKTRLDSNTVYSSSDFETSSLHYYINNASSTIGAYTGIQFAVGNNGDAAISAIRTGDGESALTFGTRGAGVRGERVRIDFSGNLLVGTTDANPNSGYGVKLNGGTGARTSVVGAADTNANFAFTAWSASPSAYRFQVGWGGTIYATSTSITAISDASLKTNIRDLETGLTQIMALKPRRFDWINGDASNVAGFVAQEVQQVLPDLVEDYRYSDEETKLGLKMGDMIPTLVKAIQEQQALITQLQADVAALKGA